MLGPRIGKYSNDGSANPIPGPQHGPGLPGLPHPVARLVRLQSRLDDGMAGATAIVAHIAVTTNTAAAFGAVGATMTAWLIFGKPDLSMILNGALAGLVAITAPCPWWRRGRPASSAP